MPWYKRPFDIVLSTFFILFFSPLLLLLALAIKLSSEGPVLHRSQRFGRNNQLFLMPKFRSMRIDAPQLPTHLLSHPENYLTPIGSFLRRSSLDELPQLWAILMGDMSFVGPRPALFNQDDLIALRTAQGIHAVVPGLTGWAQVNGRDELPIHVKVQYDQEYLRRHSFLFDLQIMCLTVKKSLLGEGIQH